MGEDSEPADAAPQAPAFAEGEAPSPAAAMPSAVPSGIRARATRDFALFAVAAAVLVVLSGFLLWPANPASRNSLDRWNRDPSSLWTSSESHRLATWDKTDFFRRGFPGPGPAPLTNPRTRNYPAVPDIDRDGRRDARDRFLQVGRAMAQWRRQRRAPNSTAPPLQAQHWRGSLSLTEQELPRGSAEAAINYQRALINYWSHDRSAALRSLNAAHCPDEAVDPLRRDADSAARRAMRVACLWLGARIQEARNPGDGAAMLRAAVTEASELRRDDQDAETFAVADRDYFIAFDTAEIWADYLASLLARKDPKPLAKDDLSAVTTLAESPSALKAHPDLLAMVKMLLVRDGRLTELGRADFPPVAANQPEPVRALASAADVVAGMADEREAAVDEDVVEELDNWIAHNCHRREQLSGENSKCASGSEEFKTWESGWKSELKRLAASKSPTFGGIVDAARIVVLIFFWLYLAWCLRMLWIRRKLIELRCEEIFTSSHLADHLERPRAAPATAGGGGIDA
jgi:hypothetical protein